MKIKLKNGVTLPNIWKQCGCSYDDWQDLHNGKSVEVGSVPSSIENNVDVITSTTKSKKEKKGDK